MAKTGSFTCTHFAKNGKQTNHACLKTSTKLFQLSFQTLLQIRNCLISLSKPYFTDPVEFSAHAVFAWKPVEVNQLAQRFSKEMFFRKYGIPEYKRRGPDDGGHSAVKAVKGNIVTLDNTWVVPFNPYLTMKFQAHINCEIVNSVAAVKYVYKYMKGSDRILVNMKRTKLQTKLEPMRLNYLNARYVSPSNAFWRFTIFQYIPGNHQLKNYLFICPGNKYSHSRKAKPKTRYSNPRRSFVDLNSVDCFARTLLDTEILSFFTWNAKSKN